MTEATPLASEQTLDWCTIAKLSGEHGVRYRTNTSLARFLDAVIDHHAALSASPAPSGQGVSGEGWDHRHRPLAFGEIIEAGDECRRDDGTWVTGVCVGEPAPDPAYTSHRLYRRLKAAPAPSCAPGEVAALLQGLLDKRWASSSGEWGLPDWVETDEPRRVAEQILAALSPQGLDAKEGGE